MGDRSKIEWTDATWNPVTGCTKVSEGCRNCYAQAFAERFRGTPGHYFENGFDITLRPEKLDQPIRWTRPRRIFVNSMSDLFHEQVPDDFIDKVFAVIALSPQHTFQILTKRPKRMMEYLNTPNRDEIIGWEAHKLYESIGGNYKYVSSLVTRSGTISNVSLQEHPNAWPLPNVWLGVSVENQRAADERIPLLLQTPAAVRFLSCEPLLGPVLLTGVGKKCYGCVAGVPHRCRNILVDWVIVGGESGPGARPMHPDWVRSIRDQCVAAEVPFFFKQWGEWAQIHELRCNEPGIKGKLWYNFDPDTSVCRIGKKAAGRELDGRTWDEMPGVIK